jgi:hypothetical protein
VTLLEMYQNSLYRIVPYPPPNTDHVEIYSGLREIVTCPNGKEISWDLDEPSSVKKWLLFLEAMELT